MAMQCAVCRARIVRHSTPLVLSNRFIASHFCRAQSFRVPFSVEHLALWLFFPWPIFPRGPFRGAGWWFQSWPRHPVTANHHLGRSQRKKSPREHLVFLSVGLSVKSQETISDIPMPPKELATALQCVVYSLQNFSGHMYVFVCAFGCVCVYS